PGSGSDPVVVTFSTAGDFAYYCTRHLASMQGVVYVVE
ncbi:MAG: plastocyanin, partial [Myxococcota bacterium]